MTSGPLIPPSSQAQVLDKLGRFTPFWFNFFNQINALINPSFGDVEALKTQVAEIQTVLAAGFNGTIITAKLTVAGTTGTMTFAQGVLINEVAAT